MANKILNIGILAHVDAGKTSLTERLLFDHGVLRVMGSVDDGTTATDSGDLERERGITIRSAVTSFNIGDLQVNLIDTPGHPDFIAEVERALSVLDGVILVISSVEGVQAQTRILMRSLQKINMPMIIFANKIDRTGARTDDLLAEIRRRLTPNILPMNTVEGAGGRTARISFDSLTNGRFRELESEAIIERDNELLEKLIEALPISSDDLFRSLREQTHRGAMHPLFFGSALEGIGIESLCQGIRQFLPSTARQTDDGADAAGTAFAIERSAVGTKIAYFRLFRGALREREAITYSQRESNGQIKEHEEVISSLEEVSFTPGKPQARRDGEANGLRKAVTAGNIARVQGLSNIRVGAQLGGRDGFRSSQHFPPPSLESIIYARSEIQKTKLHIAIMAMSDEDPMIQARVTEDSGLSILLYGEVQKEVIRDRLIREHRIEAEFSENKPIYFERPAGTGEALFRYDKINVKENVFPISIGLRVEPNATGQGNHFEREVKWGLMPGGFYKAIEESAMRTLSQGLFGWEVTDCAVYLTEVDYERPLTVAAHFRYLTAILVMRALKDAGSQVFEPYSTFELEVPHAEHGALIGYLTTMGAAIEKTEQSGERFWLINGTMPSRIVQEVTRELPGLTNGEGVIVAFPGSHHPIRGKISERERQDGNPLEYNDYLKYLIKNRLM